MEQSSAARRTNVYFPEVIYPKIIASQDPSRLRGCCVPVGWKLLFGEAIGGIVLPLLRSMANFSDATFSAEVDFGNATFSAEVNFGYATFKEYVRFAGTKENQVFGDQSSLNLQFARIEKPDRLSFHTVPLRPHWFVNVDARWGTSAKEASNCARACSKRPAS